MGLSVLGMGLRPFLRVLLSQPEDKTGTLTQGKMTMTNMCPGGTEGYCIRAGIRVTARFTILLWSPWRDVDVFTCKVHNQGYYTVDNKGDYKGSKGLEGLLQILL